MRPSKLVRGSIFRGAMSGENREVDVKSPALPSLDIAFPDVRRHRLRSTGYLLYLVSRPLGLPQHILPLPTKILHVMLVHVALCV
jgi:hypothetical protein